MAGGGFKGQDGKDRGMRSDDEYEKVILTPEEEMDAILEGKRKKYFHEKHKAYWEEKEKPKTKTDNHYGTDERSR